MVFIDTPLSFLPPFRLDVDSNLNIQCLQSQDCNSSPVDTAELHPLHGWFYSTKKYFPLNISDTPSVGRSRTTFLGFVSLSLSSSKPGSLQGWCWSWKWAGKGTEIFCNSIKNPTFYSSRTILTPRQGEHHNSNSALHSLLLSSLKALLNSLGLKAQPKI